MRKFFVSGFFLFAITLQASENGLDEFNLERFQNSSFNCSLSVDCNHGTCVNAGCYCELGYRDSVHKPCVTHMATLDKKKPFYLEAFLGLIFPAGLAYVGMWEFAVGRLFLEALTIGLFVGGWRSPSGSFEKPAYYMSSAVFGAMHVAAYIFTSVVAGEFYYPSPGWKESWKKNRGMADLVVPANLLADSTRIIQKSFSDSDCAVLEGCVDGTGTRRLLVFDTYLYNQGDSDFVVGLEQIKPQWSVCHQHYHGPDSSTYILTQTLDLNNGTSITRTKYGHKQGYCFLDHAKFNGTNNAGKFSCGLPQITWQYTQGITAGWADLYGRWLDCQWVDITGVEPGNYELTITVNPNGSYYQDETLTNNYSTIRVTIPTPTAEEKKPLGIPVNSVVISGPQV